MTRILLDTHILVWMLVEPEKLPVGWRNRLATGDGILFSAASIWEIAIKFGLKRTKGFNFDPRQILAGAREADLVELTVSAELVAGLHELPNHHGDPFDRLLIAQALQEGAILLTADKPLVAYGEPVQLVR